MTLTPPCRFGSGSSTAESGGAAEGAGAGAGAGEAGGGGGVAVGDEVEGMVSRMVSKLNAITVGWSAEGPFVHTLCTHTELHHYYELLQVFCGTS
eukprot:COSAG01_NODE_8138_length_2908_cov_6.747241_4_plen_95_part_00